jgi:hypothetical protein
MQATDPTSLADQLQRLEDRQAIAQLVAQLGRMLDEKRFDEARSILADDIIVRTPGGESRGPDAVAAQAERTHTVSTQHAISDVVIDLAGDRAQVRANLIATFAPDQPGAHLVVGGAEHPDSYLSLGEVYRFEAVRTDAGWRLARIASDRVWSSHALPARPTVGQTTD